ncbi:MaoC/PaaZ C-terminal domain-containing protein [Dietzia kunjamensis]|uniref:MaoC/PaaZ C-terminal domain-containing protein n=1 Tax=Dietzia kunjamensis TaxID=322509 RepID=UPI0009F41D39
MFRTQGRTTPEADLVTFAGWSRDINLVHTDAVTTAEGRFSGPIAHGGLGLSVLLGLACAREKSPSPLSASRRRKDRHLGTPLRTRRCGRQAGAERPDPAGSTV